MSDKAEVEKVARQIAERFGEGAERPRQQLERMTELMGAAWMADVAEQASREIAAAGPLTLRADGTPRAKSGVFFALARRVAFEQVTKGTLARRDFYSTFCWRERKPREPRPAGRAAQAAQGGRTPCGVLGEAPAAGGQGAGPPPQGPASRGDLRGPASDEPVTARGSAAV